MNSQNTPHTLLLWVSYGVWSLDIEALDIGGCLNIKILSHQYKCIWFTIIKIRQSHYCLLFIMGIPISGKIIFVLRRSPGLNLSNLFWSKSLISSKKKTTPYKALTMDYHGHLHVVIFQEGESINNFIRDREDPCPRGLRELLAGYGADALLQMVSILLTLWGWVTHVCVTTNIASDNSLSPVRRQAIIWSHAAMLSIRP